jgi:hypothetical protein
MEDSQHFKQTRIISEGESVDNTGSGDRVRFEIEAAYTPFSQAQPVSGGMN